MPVNSDAWICAWTMTAGFSSGGPVSRFVTVTSGISRPSYEVPIDSTVHSAREVGRPGAERLRQLRVRVEALELDAHER